MSRITVTTWPFGRSAAASEPQFTTTRQVRSEAISTVAILVLVLAGVLTGSGWGYLIAALALAAIFVALLVVDLRHIDEPGTPVSGERSLALSRVFWVAQVATLVVVVAVAAAVAG